MDSSNSDIEDDSFDVNQYFLRDFLKIPSGSRSPHQIKIISKLLLQIEFFGQYRNNPILLGLAKEVQHKDYVENAAIYHQGDPGDAFYAVVQGTVKICVIIPSEIKNINNTV